MHIIVTAIETEEDAEHNGVREESDETSYKKLCMHCKDNDHFIKNCKLLSAV
jgi:hypothetical protein